MCSFDGCNQWAWARGYCDKHYQKLKRDGVIVATRVKNDPIGRFNARYKINEVTGCWEWTALLHPKGYGLLPMGSKLNMLRAHRFSYEMHKGEIPEGAMICHTCDNRKCVNPDHLYAGTATDNAKDMVARGRCKANGIVRKFTPQMAMNVRIMFARGKHSMVKLADIYSVDHSTISGIVNGRTYL